MNIKLEINMITSKSDGYFYLIRLIVTVTLSGRTRVLEISGSLLLAVQPPILHIIVEHEQYNIRTYGIKPSLGWEVKISV